MGALSLNFKKRLRLGVLGGMGPLATAVFYHRLVDFGKLDSSCDQDHIDTLIWSDCSIPDRTTVIKSGNPDALLAQCAEGFKILENGGCDFICFPCNTLYYYYEDLQKLTPVPILNMIDITIAKLKEQKPDAKKIQVFATDGTRETGLYEKYAARYGLEVVPVSDELQKEIMSFIYELKNTGRTDFPELSQRILQARKAGVDFVILACTELSCIPLTAKASAYAYDAMNCLIESCIELVLSRSE